MPSPPAEKICAHCGATWATRSLHARTCSPKCRALLRETEHPTQGRALRDYPSDIVAEAQRLYEAGATVREIGEALGPGYRAQTVLERHVEERRPAVPRDQTGERNPAWRGDAASYQALHLRVEALQGKPARCACCDTTDEDTRYEWANLSGHYEDIHDYARLCIPCHRRLDAARRAATGRRTSPSRGGEANV